MNYNPLPSQAVCFDKLISNDRFGLFVRMGVGKTAPTLTAIEQLMNSYFKVKRVLVVAPKRVALLTWPEEIAKWSHLRRLTYTVLHGSKKDSLIEDTHKTDITIINYEGLQWMWNNKSKFKEYDLIVFDESTYIKNWSGRTKLSHKIAKQIPYVYLLTGAPRPKSLMDLYGQIYALDRGKRLGYNITSFRNEFFYSPTEHVYIPQADAKERILERLADITYVVGNEDTTGIPIQNDVPVRFDVPTNVLVDIQNFKKKSVLELDYGTMFKSDNPQSKAQKLKQMASGFIYDYDGTPIILHEARLQALRDLIQRIGKNVLVAINYQTEVDMIREFFGYKIPCLNSDTPEKEGTKHIQDWKKGELPVFLVHPRSMSHGLNMQSGGNDIIWYSLTNDLEVYEQLIGRLRRRGQLESVVNNYILTANETIDELTLKLIQDKAESQEDFLKRLKEWKKL